MYVDHETPGMATIKLWCEGVEVEQEALDQLRNVAALPFIYRHLAVMPDVHAGMGATIGSVIPTIGAIIPAAVGVDIGCGMMCVRVGLRKDNLNNLPRLRAKIEKAVPHGRTDNGGSRDRGRWGTLPEDVAEAWKGLQPEYERLVEKYPLIGRANSDVHLGTLGTGNHFIEVCLDEKDCCWAMLHSGSRGIGGKIGSHFIELAKEGMKRWYIDLPDADLAYIPEGTEHFGQYLFAANWAQKFARVNRELMMNRVLGVLRQEYGEFKTYDVVNCHHNYISKERHFGKDVWVTRKGAVSAKKGEMGIIPGSMGARSYIVRGMGNQESFHSCSHGAGRLMSRTKAKKKFSLEDHARATEGIECKKDASVLDETPGAYKDIDKVMAAQSELVEVVHRLRQILCIKG